MATLTDAGTGRLAPLFSALWFSRYVGAGIARALPSLMRRSLRQGLHGVWGRGGLGASGACVVAANHHSWWDGYLVWLLLEREGRSGSLLMDDAQLRRFGFFRHLGVIGRGEVREALRRLARGDALVVFPEGELRPPGRVFGCYEGAAYFAAASGVPLVPVAIRVALRGAQAPEAYLSIGEALGVAKGSDRAGLTRRLEDRLNAMITDTDAAVLEHDPERALPGFERWLHGQRSTHERTAWLEGLWRS